MKNFYKSVFSAGNLEKFIYQEHKNDVLNFSEKETFSEEYRSLLSDLQREIEGPPLKAQISEREYKSKQQVERGNLEFKIIENGEIEVSSWEKTTSIISSHDNIQIKNLDIDFPNTKEGWAEASRSANFINFLKKKLEGMHRGTFEINRKGKLVRNHVYPIQEHGLTDKIVNDGATTLLSADAWDKFPQLSANKNVFVDYLTKEFNLG